MALQTVSSIIIAIAAAGLLIVAGITLIGLIKICQAWAWLYKDQGHRDG